MKILSINKHDIYGGAARIANDLHHGLKDRGHASRFAVEQKIGNDLHTFLIPDLPPQPGLWGKFLWKLRTPWKKRMGKRGTGVALRWIQALADPVGEYHRQYGHEVFNYPGSSAIFKFPLDDFPQILQLHNLHRNFFDLRILPKITHEIPTCITLHDEWLFTGHCAYTFNCGRWQTGCGNCPDLTIYPNILRDGTHFNWEQKRAIYQRSKYSVVTPSKWLMDRVEKSILAEGMVARKVIPNGVDQKIFAPAHRKEARNYLGINPDASVILFMASSKPMKNKFKDFQSIKLAVEMLSQMNHHKIVILAVGSEEISDYFDLPNIRIEGFVKKPVAMAHYYQASDIYLHAAFSENYPTAILESLSCGTPVIATEVGGISEQIQPGENGFLVEKQDFKKMAYYANLVLNDKVLHSRLSTKAIEISKQYFGLEKMLDSYESWYKEILETERENEQKK